MKERLVELFIILLAALLLTLGNAMDWQQADSGTVYEAVRISGQTD